MTYENPILKGFYPDPSICRVEDDYYLITSSFSWFPGIPLFHSRDLVNWRQIGHVCERPEQLNFDQYPATSIWRGVWAPTLRHHNGRFYCVTTNNNYDGNVLFWSDRIEGPWSDPILLDHKGWDNSLCFGRDDTVYYHWTQGGKIWQTVLDLETGKFQREPEVIYTGSGANGLEAPHLYQIGDWWYLIVAEGGTHWIHQVTIARSRSPWGPFETQPNGPMLTHRNTEMNQVLKGLGHADIVQAQDGSWWLVCLAMRHFGWICYGSTFLGRETVLAGFEWDADGWPVVNGGQELSTTMPAPNLPPDRFPSLHDEADHSSHYFSHLAEDRQAFADPLPPQWNWLRCPPKSDAWQVDENETLWMQGEHPLTHPRTRFLGRRHQDPWMTFSVAVDLGEAREAGIAAFMDEHYHSLLGIRNGAEGRVLFFRRKLGCLEAEKTFPLPESGGASLTLFIESEPRFYHFGYQTLSGEKVVLDHAETHHHSTEIAYGFTGVYLGVHVWGGAAGFRDPSYVADRERVWTPDLPERFDIVPGS